VEVPVTAREGVTVVVPTYNEAENVPVLFERLAEAFDAAGRPFELLVVDDDSPDGTGARAAGLGPRARAIVRKGERGLATAVIRGLREARYDLCVCMDADLSHPPETVPVLVDRVEAGAPFALGSRYVSEGKTVDWGLLRWVNSAGATLLARPLTRVRDPMSGFFCVRRADVPLDALDPVGYKIALEILVKAAIRDPVEVPITFRNRLHGESKLTLKEQLAYLTHLVRLYRWRHGVLAELVSFGAVGATGVVVDLAVLTLLVEVAGVWFGWARLGGFVAAVSWNFLLNDRFTFGDPGTHARPRSQRYALFVGVSGIGLVANWTVSVALWASIGWLQRWYWLAALAGVAAGGLLNFTGARLLAFRKRPA
jgi:dolichol-phosphate mannosyltransferase